MDSSLHNSSISLTSLNPRPLFINANPLLRETTGIERYANEICQRITPILRAKGVAVDFVSDKPSNRGSTCMGGEVVWVPGQRHRLACRAALSHRLHKQNAVFVNFTGPYAPTNNSIVCIYDMRSHEEGFDNLRGRMRAELARRSALREGVHIITLSEFTKRRILAAYSIEPERIHVAGCGWEHIAAIAPDMEIFEKNTDVQLGGYFYTLGTLLPHKSIRWVFQVARKNPERQFVIAGAMATNAKDEMQDLNNVKLLGRVSDAENVALMKNARAYVHPSLYEGFGIPPLEAAACGLSLIVSSSTSLPEVYESFAALFDPLDYNVDLTSLLNSADERRSRYPELLKKHSWETSANHWVEYICDALDGCNG